MKKIIITSILSSLICVASFGQSLPRTILSHGGELTQYNLDHWMDAFSDAQNGDTIYFTSGTFTITAENSNLIIEKVVTLIGAGVSENSAFFKGITTETDYVGSSLSDGTTIRGTITLSIDGNPDFYMEGINLQAGDLLISKTINNLVIKRCQVRKDSESNYGTGNLGSSVAVNSITLVNCYVRSFDGSNMSSYMLMNSWIGDISNLSIGANVYNCVITGISNTTNCSFINCVVQGWAEYNTYQNCLLSIGDTTNCTLDNTCVLYHYGVPQNYTQAQLQDAVNGGWTEDTSWTWKENVVPGVFTGTAPFTFLPSQPYVSSSTVSYNSTTNKLDVNITVKKGK